MPVKSSTLNSLAKQKRKGKKLIDEEAMPAVDQSTLAAIAAADAASQKTAPKSVATMPAWRQKQRIGDKKRNRLIIDCSTDVSDAINAIYEMYRKKHGDTRDPFPKSDLVEFLIVLGLRNMIEDGGGLRRLMVTTTSPHFLNRLTVPPVPDISEYNADNDEVH